MIMAETLKICTLLLGDFKLWREIIAFARALGVWGVHRGVNSGQRLSEIGKSDIFYFFGILSLPFHRTILFP